ncbi:glucosaminidase domain-containing protein, partial [Candidatus Caldatribacterium sp.]|uniref:glucosaminidase domain-containing protein n=1 Tax=Candidatus Caldatribacterium sp. TaxID=2282143 RepID=UPI0038446C8A|nr:glucosaminidase domain-containing protein [Candidatus Caldatribacterium sp.]
MSTQHDFITYLKPYAQVAEAKYGIDWRIIVTQAALETGWGSTMSRNPFNLWGMRFTGPAGVDPEGYALFSDQWEAVESYIYNVKKHHITAWQVRNNPEAFFREIQSTTPPNTGAWAEDPLYTEKLLQIFNQYFRDEPTAVDSTKPPQDTIDTFSTYFPDTAQRIQRFAKDKKGASIQQRPYYVKLQHVDRDDEPQNALTIKITPDSQLLVVREKLLKEPQGEQSQVAGFKVSEAISLQLQTDGLLLDYHSNGGDPKAQKVTNQVQLKADYLGLVRVKEGQKKRSESLILGDDLVQVEVNNDEVKNRIELQPRKILLKIVEQEQTDYIRVETDTFQAKNKSGSQIFMKDDLIVGENATRTQVYLRGDLGRIRNKTGSYVQVARDTVEAKNASGSYVRIVGDTVEARNASGSHVHITGD